MMNTSSIQKKKQLLTPMKESSFKGFDITLFTTITVLGFYLRRYLIYYILIGLNGMFSLHFRVILQQVYYPDARSKKLHTSKTPKNPFN